MCSCSQQSGQIQQISRSNSKSQSWDGSIRWTKSNTGAEEESLLLFLLPSEPVDEADGGARMDVTAGADWQQIYSQLIGVRVCLILFNTCVNIFVSTSVSFPEAQTWVWPWFTPLMPVL